MDVYSRQIFVHDAFGKRQLRETLSDLLVGLILSPDEIWLVSPWISDFELLDNRSGDWDFVQPAWGARYVMFSELIAAAVESGGVLHCITNHDELNEKFHYRLAKGLTQNHSYTWLKNDLLHTKGLLCSSFFLAGSMNFTYSGTHRNDEYIQLSVNTDAITEAKLEFENRYLG